MGQRISSSRLTSLVSPDQHLPPCTHTQLRQRTRRLSLGSLEDTSFRSLSCLRGHTDSPRQSHHTTHYTRSLKRSKSQDREPSHSIMSSQQPQCNCNSICSQCGNSNAILTLKQQRSEDLQNGNANPTNTCVKSSSIERYMSALTERMEQTLLTNSSENNKHFVQAAASSSSVNSNSKSNICICNTNTTNTSSNTTFKTRSKGKSKLSLSKSYSKQLDRAPGTQDCFSCLKDNAKERSSRKTSLKKKIWVPKLYSSKLAKSGGKISVNGVGGSTDSGLDVASSSNDPTCICTSYKKVDDACRLTQSNELSNNTPANVLSNIARHECDGSRCITNRNSNGDITHSLINLPINITVSRVCQPMYSALITTANSNNPNVYGTLTHNGSTNIYGALLAEDGNSILLSVGTQNTPLIDLRLSAEEYPVEDCEERARVRRAWEIAEGVDPPPGYRPHPHIQVLSTNELRTLFLQRQSRIHTQVDFIHCLVPDLKAINQCSFYWGKMDRYEAERLLEGTPEGTFLLRDSAQEDYLFSVSFRKYGRSLHARIEQFNHKFSFDSHDPGVYAASTVTGLIEHYKDPACVMFFEPMLTAPLSRTNPFPLQHLCRAVIASCTTYDGINELRLPSSLKTYLKEYHYRQRVRVKRFEEPPEGFHWASEEAI